MKNGLYLFLLSSCLISAAQDREPIVTDRPNQTEASVLVPQGRFQVETGFLSEKNGVFTNQALNTTLLRYGLNKYFELRFRQDYLGEKGGGNSESGLSSMKLGMKAFLSDEDGWIPQACFIGHITLPTGEIPFRQNYISSDFRFSVSHTLSNKMSLGYNLGLQNDAVSPGYQGLYSMCFSIMLADKFNSFIEPYGYFMKGQLADNRFDFGITFQPTPYMQFDLSSGFGLSDIAPDSFISIGFSAALIK